MKKLLDTDIFSKPGGYTGARRAWEPLHPNAVAILSLIVATLLGIGIIRAIIYFWTPLLIIVGLTVLTIMVGWSFWVVGKDINRW